MTTLRQRMVDAARALSQRTMAATLADALRQCGPAFLEKYTLNTPQAKA